MIPKNRIADKVYYDKKIDEISRIHTDFLLTEPDTISSATNYSLFQYCNSSLCKQHAKVAYEIANRLDLDKSYLNIGTGPGFLEKIIERNSPKTRFHTSEWVEQAPVFERIISHQKVKNYFSMSDITKDDFKIELPSNEKYDYALLIRFFPTNVKWAKTKDRFETLIDKLKPYVDNVMIIDHQNNIDQSWMENFDYLGHMGLHNKFLFYERNLISQKSKTYK